MPSALRQFICRSRPFLFLFFAIESVMRLLLLGREWAQIPHEPLLIIKTMLMGFVFDAGVFAYFLSLFALYLFALPTRLHGSMRDRWITNAWLFLATFTLLFTCVSEWFFWDEFQARFNFIAVDYLVYTREVVGNIQESYPVAPIILVVLALSLSISYVCARSFRAQQASAPARQRGWVALGMIIVTAASWGILRSPMSCISDNHYANEAAKNGMYELFAAFWNNNLNYKRFYATGDDAELTAHLSKKLHRAPDAAGMVHSGGTEQPYNVVLITIESMSASFMDSFKPGQGLTPNLDALAKQSVFFTNLYATGTRTVYGLSATSLGIPPVAGNSIVRRPHNENLFTLATVLNAKGYASKFIYGGYGYFDNMNYFFSHNGYEIIDRNNLAADEKSFANVWGVSDEDLFLRTLRENDKAYAEKRPFFDHVMTTSNHRPYTYPDGRIDLASHSGRPGAVKYTDYAIGKFIAEAKKRPWFDRTIFVITADHTASSSGKSELDPQGYHIPLLVYAPKILAPKQIDTLTSQIDIPPTVLGMMNMNYASRFWGQDALREPPHRAFISNYQQLGYMTDDQLVVLKPVKKMDFYRKKGESFIRETTPDSALLKDALSYYQNANHWREWNRADVDPNPRPATPDALTAR